MPSIPTAMTHADRQVIATLKGVLAPQKLSPRGFLIPLNNVIARKTLLHRKKWHLPVFDVLPMVSMTTRLQNQVTSRLVVTMVDMNSYRQY